MKFEVMLSLWLVVRRTVQFLDFLQLNEIDGGVENAAPKHLGTNLTILRDSGETEEDKKE